MIPLYILCMLRRFGPMHISLRSSSQSSSRTLRHQAAPIYYHLERLAAEGFVSAASEKPGARPEKTVYAIAESGVARFKELLSAQLEFRCHPTFHADSAFYFADDLDPAALVFRLNAYADKLDASLHRIEAHRVETVPYVPPEMRAAVKIIFDHHERHCATEWDWARAAAALLTERGSL